MIIQIFQNKLFHALIVVLPSKEGFGNSVIEASSCGAMFDVQNLGLEDSN